MPRAAAPEADPVRWVVRWNGTEIGWAENRIRRQVDGTGCIENQVQFRQLPVDQLLGDLMGVLGRFAQPVTGELGPIDLRVATQLDFDTFGSLSRFESRVDVGTLKDLMIIVGQVSNDTLDLAARVSSAAGDSKEIYRNRQIAVPPDMLVADTFSPRPRLAGLRVGQTWTFQSYQPLMPYNPLTLIEATVDREELIESDGQMVRAMKVVFRKDSGSGISSTRRPMSEIWVSRDGTVLRQDMWLANVRVQFLRVNARASEMPSATATRTTRTSR